MGGFRLAWAVAGVIGVPLCLWRLAVLRREVVDERRRDRGASAVEMALVLPFLLTLTVGIVDYSTFFLRAQATSGSVREAARVAATGTVAPGCATGTIAAQTACTVRDQSGEAATVSKVSAVGPGGQTDLWDIGSVITICSMVPVNGLTHLLPMPNGGYVRVKVVTRGEDKVGNVPAVTEAAPAGQDWSWCT